MFAPSRGSGSGEAAGELVDGVLLHRQGDVAVDVHRRGDDGVPEAFLHDLMPRAIIFSCTLIGP